MQTTPRHMISIEGMRAEAVVYKKAFGEGGFHGDRLAKGNLAAAWQWSDLT
jgi:hypothetical protein